MRDVKGEAIRFLAKVVKSKKGTLKGDAADRWLRGRGCFLAAGNARMLAIIELNK